MNRLFCLLIGWLLSLSVSAQPLVDLPVSAAFAGQPLSEVFSQLARDYPVSFYYQAAWLPSSLITREFSAAPLGAVLQSLLADTELSYEVYDNYAVIIAPADQLSQSLGQSYYASRYAAANENDVLPTTVSTIDIGDPATPLQQASEQANIRGTITDATTGEPLVGALVFVKAKNQTAITDPDGQYELQLPSGEHLAEVQFIGYKTQLQRLQVYNSGTWNLGLQQEAYNLKEVIIREKADDNNIQNTQIGVEALSAKTIKELPSFLGEADVIKSLLSLPGVSSIGEGATGFNVRGGNIDQNLIMQDGGLVFNSSHVLGFFSIFNADAIQNVALYKGHIPAQFGGRISSVLDVQLKDGDYDKFHVNGGLGLVASRLTLEGPLVKEKTSFLLSGRSTYSNWVLRQVKEPDISNSKASFYDFTAKLTQRLAKGGNISASWYQTSDQFQFSNEFGYDWTTRMANFKWNQILAPAVSSSLTAVYGDTNNSYFDPEGTDAFLLRNGLDYYKIKEDVFVSVWPGHDIRLGGEWIRYNSRPETLEPNGAQSAVLPNSIAKDSGQEFGFYVNNEWVFNARLSINVGLRYSLYQQLGPAQVYLYTEGQPRQLSTVRDSLTFGDGKAIETYSGWEPRLSMRYRLDDKSSVKLSYNRLFQYIHLISNTTAATPTDTWQVSTRYVPPQRADNFSLGYFRNFRNNVWETSLEVFYKNINNLLDYKDLSVLLQNQQLETELLSGAGRAFGSELSIRKQTGRLTGWLAYTFSRAQIKVVGESAEETINGGDWYATNFDKPHTLNLNFNYRLTKRHKVAVNFVYSTGRPVTAPIANYFIGATVIPHFSERNQFRIPDYHRLDLSYTINRNAIRKSRYKGSLTVAIYNVYFRKNAFSVFFRRDVKETDNTFKLAVLGTAFPAITYNFSF